MRRALVIAFAIALVAIGTGSTAAFAQFKSSSVTLFIPSGIGGGYDIYARLVGRHLGRFLPGNPAIIPKNMPGAGGVILGNYLYNVAPKDGSAVAEMQAGMALEPLFGNTLTRYEAAKFNWLASLNRLISIAVFWHAAPVYTPEDFFKGPVTVGSSGGGDASTDIMPNMLNLLAGTKFKTVTGYTGIGETMLAMERGEVEGIVGHELNALRAGRPNWLRDNLARIVVQIGITKAEELPDVPMATDLIKSEDDRKIYNLLLTRQIYGRPFALPPGVAPDIVETYRKAFAAMAKDPAFRKDAENMKADILFNSGDEINALIARTYATPRPVVERAIAVFKKAAGGGK